MVLPLQIEDVRPCVAGHWLEVFARLSPELEPAIRKIGRHVPCPVHGGRDGFRLFRDAAFTGGGICNTCGAYHDGFELLGWLKRWTFSEVIEQVGWVLGLHSGEKPRKLPPIAFTSRPSRRQSELDRALIDRLNTIWSESRPLQHADSQPARDYLRHRGIVMRLKPDWDSVLRCHPELPYFNEDGHFVGRYPALIARVFTAKGRPATLHRVYLTREGQKAPVAEPRKLMPIPGDRPITGGAIRLGEPQPVMGVAEGIETALAVTRATGQTVWPAVNATLLARFEPPAECTRLYLWSDSDRSDAGLNAAAMLKERACERGIETRVLVPPIFTSGGLKSWDWNDILNVYGVMGFPRVYH